MIHTFRSRYAWAVSAVSLMAIVGVGGCSSQPSSRSTTPAPAPAPTPQARQSPAPEPGVAEASIADVRKMCGACHAVPRPGDFPKKLWRPEVAQGYGFFQSAHLAFAVPPLESVLAYYYNHAPETIPVDANTLPLGNSPINFVKTKYELPDAFVPGVANVSLVRLSSSTKLDVLACQLFPGALYLLRPYMPGAKFTKIASVPFPGHAAVTDLDGDGVPDILVAVLGSFVPSNDKVGSVVWLRGRKMPSGLTFTPFTLLAGVGRVADVEAVDAGGGRKDLIVGEFGHHALGSIIYLENQTTDWTHPKFVPHTLNKRTGTIHVPIANLTGHGNKDCIALQSQEHEIVVALLHKGRGQYEEKTVYEAPQPAAGSSGIQLVDLNHTGKTGVLYTSGDLFDPHALLRHDQGVQYLENTGTYPFKAHKLAEMYGCYHAVGADFDGSGRMGVVAVSNIPHKVAPERESKHLDAVIYLQPLPNGQYKKYSLEQGTCDHYTCDAGDIFGSGRADFVTANYQDQGETDTTAVTIWRNMGPSKK